MSEEQEPKQPHLDGRIYSPWFPYAGDDPDPWSRVSKALPIVRYEPRPDLTVPDPAPMRYRVATSWWRSVTA